MTDTKLRHAGVWKTSSAFLRVDFIEEINYPATVVLRVLGVIARLDRNVSEALRYGALARDVAYQVRNHWMLARTTEEMGVSLLVANRPEDAVASFADAAISYARIGAEIRSDRLRTRLEEISDSS